MKSFSFRLQRILKLREDAEQAQARRYGAASQVEAEADRQCRNQAEHLERVADRLTPPVGARTNAGLLRAIQLTSAAATRQLEDAEQARQAAEAAAEAERIALTKARVERKALERLKEHHTASWREGVERQDQRDTDEIASRRRNEP